MDLEKSFDNLLCSLSNVTVIMKDKQSWSPQATLSYTAPWVPAWSAASILWIGPVPGNWCPCASVYPDPATLSRARVWLRSPRMRGGPGDPG